MKISVDQIKYYKSAIHSSAINMVRPKFENEANLFYGVLVTLRKKTTYFGLKVDNNDS